MVTFEQPMALTPTDDEVKERASASVRIKDALRPSSTKASQLSHGVTTSLMAVVAALRWGAAMIGLAWAVRQVDTGGLPVVLTLTVAIFITSWRTIVPIRLGEPGAWPMVKACTDVAALAAAIGLSDGLSGPFTGSLFIAVAVAGLGWGLGWGLFNGLLAVALTELSSVLFGPANPTGDQFPGPLAVMFLAGAAILPGLALDRMSEIEVRRKEMADQRDRLAEANDLLAMLSDLARTLPSSLDLNDVVAGTRQQLVDTFGARRTAIVSYEEGYWSPQHQDGFDLPPQSRTLELPPPLEMVAVSGDVVLIEDLSVGHGRTGSGLYTRLVVSGVDIGLVALEHPDPRRYTKADGELLRSMSDVLALTLANARSFRRLRSLAAAEERSRIARDLHDRLGQYLTYIALELERINSERDEPSSDLKKLHEDVQGAIGEFRDTLIELRAAVSAERPLSVVLTEVVDRFRRRSQIDVKLTVPRTAERLPGITENELLRIAQEALVNVQKHAGAAHVHLRWAIADGRGVLVIEDDGRGFDPAKGIRGSAYGLVGMRERAASVGAMLEISSAPGEGTTITVQTSQTSEQVKKP
jgi:signal transduction histidine kinase